MEILTKMGNIVSINENHLVVLFLCSSDLQKIASLDDEWVLVLSNLVKGGISVSSSYLQNWVCVAILLLEDPNGGIDQVSNALVKPASRSDALEDE